MPSARTENNHGITAFLIIFSLAQFFFFLSPYINRSSAESSPEMSRGANTGVVVKNDVPEVKKGTVLSKEPSAVRAVQPMAGNALKEEEGLSEAQKEARAYHIEGANYQNKGELDTAMDYYQRAVVLDPFYAVAYNDLGIIYEALGYPERAEDAYLKALNIDSGLLGAYSNLAMYYEGRRDLKQAAYYWKKRLDMGFSDDVWTQKARQRYNDIQAVLSESPLQDRREKETIDLLKQVTSEKATLKKDDAAQGKVFFEKAKALYNKGDDVTALKNAIDAQQLDPENKEIEKFIEKVQHRVLSR